MCVRERDEGGKLVDENTLFFVALHELAHIMTHSKGHTVEFRNNFRYLLDHAVKDGYYHYQPYHQDPKKYCGTYISDTPLKDSIRSGKRGT
jgi:predicted SprT family Zn-dependent metalloprotease